MTHAQAVERAIAAARLQATDAALVELLRTLAQQMDAAGPAAGTRLAGSYLTALRTLAQRAHEIGAPPQAAMTGTAQRRARAAQRRALSAVRDAAGA